jgi:glutathione reductase (NADPH)
MFDYDLIVVGGGSGGVRAARIAAGHGARVALVEAYRLGGTCVIRGCVPKKLMVYASRFAQEFEEAAGFGWSWPAGASPQFDWATLKQRRDQEVTRLENIYRNNLLASGVTLLQGQARLMDAHTVQITSAAVDGTVKPASTLRGERILLATGAQPVEGPAIDGHHLAIDSNGFFDLNSLPSHVVVQGGGYIALELACVLQGLGAQVHVMVRSERLLNGFDHDLQTHLADALIQSGLHLHFNTELTAITQLSNGLRVQRNDGSSMDTQVVLRAIGRRPHVDGLGLQDVGVATGKNGAVLVDAKGQTSVPSIYAVGDITDRVNLTPMAIREGHAFADTVYGNAPRAVDHTLIPTAVFTTPEMGTVGMTEAQALAAYPRLDVFFAHFRPMKATLSGHPGKVMLKMLVDRDTDRVLGFHSIGPDTGEMAQLLGVAMRMHVTKQALDATLAVHPTMAEEWVTMRTPTKRHNLS